MTPDNNACKNAIQPFTKTKNWLFAKNSEGAESFYSIYSLIQTAKENGLILIKYLTELFKKAPFASTHEDWEKLLPWNIPITE